MANSDFPVYLETSLDTCLVVCASSHDTIEALKEKIAATHPLNFPNIGEIIVQSVKTCRQGKMYHLSDSMPVCTLLNGISETLLLYVEAVAGAKQERNIVNGKVDGEFEVPVRGRIEDMMVNELSYTNKEILMGPLHDLDEDLAHKLNSEKKRRRKISDEDTSMRPESRKGEDELFERKFVHEEHGCMTSNILNMVEHTPTEELAPNTIRLYPNEEADHPNCNAQAKGESDFHEQPDTNQVSNQGTKENECRTEVPNQNGISRDMSELLEENARKDDIVQPSQEANQMVSAANGGVVREKKKRKKTKGFYSDVPSEVPPIREHQPQVEDNIKISVEKDSQLPQKPGCTIETPNSIPSQHFKSKEELEGSSKAEKDIKSLNLPQNSQIAMASDMEECRSDDARTKVLKESTLVVGENPGVVFGEKKKRKKSKSAITEVSTKELSSRENESCKEEASNSVLEKKTSEARAAVFMNNAVTAVNANSTTEAVKERSRMKRKKTKASSSDMPSDVLPIGEDGSDKAGDKVQKKIQIIEEQRGSETEQKSVALGGVAEADNSVSCQLEKERLGPELSLPADNQLGTQKSAMADNNKDFGKGTEVIKKTAHVVGEEPGVVSLEKRKRKKKKSEQLTHDAAMNGYGQAEREDLSLKKEIAKETVGADLTKLAGGDDGVASKGKRKRNKTKAASTDMPPQELSALENGFSKEGESRVTLEKKACKEADKFRFRMNADNVAFLAPSSADPDDSINVSEILADLKGRPSQPDGQIDGAPQIHLLANVAVDQHKVDQYDGILVQRKDERKTGKKISNKTKTSQSTMNLLTGESVIAYDEEKTHETPKDTSAIGDDEIGNRDTFSLATQEDGVRNQTLDSSMVENSVSDRKKKRRRKQEATNSRTEAIIDGATDEANVSIKNSVPQTDASGKKLTQTKIQMSLKEDDVPANLSSGDKKPSKGKSKENGVDEKFNDATLADEMIQNAPNTPEKLQKSGENLRAENHNKGGIEAAETKGPEILHAPTTEKINFIDYFLHEGANQPADAKIAPLKETKGNKKFEKCFFSKDNTSTSVDTRVSAKAKKPTSKQQTAEKPAKSSKEHNPSGISNDKARARTTMGDDGSKIDGNMKRLLDDMAVVSDFSTDDEEEARSQLRKPMTAVRKVASKVIGENMDASRKTSAVCSSGHPDGVGSDASTRDDSGSANTGPPMRGKDKGRAMMSPSSQWKNGQVADDDVSMSQESARPMKKFDLSSVLRSSASYKKAKISLSQSQAEDYDAIDMVFETQQD